VYIKQAGENKNVFIQVPTTAREKSYYCKAIQTCINQVKLPPGAKITALYNSSLPFV